MAKDIEVVQKSPAFIAGRSSWDDVLATADKVAGTLLLKDELLDSLTGVPFLVSRVSFRDGTQEEGKPSDYVSLECVIGPADELVKRGVDITRKPFDAEEQVVFNDGSTGVYRQIVAYLHARGYIELPEPLIASGEAGTSSYDLRVSQWGDIHVGTLEVDEDGHINYDTFINPGLWCPRGLRASTYRIKGAKKDSVTRYFA